MSEGSCGPDAGALASRVSRARLLKRCEEDLVLAQAMEMAHALGLSVARMHLTKNQRCTTSGPAPGIQSGNWA